MHRLVHVLKSFKMMQYIGTVFFLTEVLLSTVHLYCYNQSNHKYFLFRLVCVASLLN